MPVQAPNGAYSFRHSAKDLGKENINLQVLAKRSGRRFSSWRETRNQVVLPPPQRLRALLSLPLKTIYIKGDSKCSLT